MKKLTQEQHIEAVKLSRNGSTIKVLGKYINAKTKILYRCTNCSNEWEALPDNVRKGCGCPKCAGAELKTHEKYMLEIKDMPLVLLDRYVNAKTLNRYRCTNCSNEWSARPNDILANKGCKLCGNKASAIKRAKTNKQYIQEVKIISPDIEVLDIYINCYTAIKHKHILCGSIWKARPGDILIGRGCPACAEHGFNTSKPAYLYFIQIEDFLKVGITNREPYIRYKELTDKEVIEIKVIEGIGSYIRELEQMIHKKYKHYNPTTLKSGNTECFTLNLKEEILSDLRNI